MIPGAINGKPAPPHTDISMRWRRCKKDGVSGQIIIRDAAKELREPDVLRFLAENGWELKDLNPAEES